VLPDQAIVALLIEGGAARAERAVRALSLIGVDDVHGVLDETALAWQEKQGGLSSIPQVSPADAAATRTARIIDVRAGSEWAEGHVPGAIHIPLPELADRMSELPEGPLILHCQGGSRSVIAASMLEAAGRTDVANMDGGYAAWRRAGLPVETGTAEPATKQESGAE
jgi:rhodanese-related sulfurtransferase